MTTTPHWDEPRWAALRQEWEFAPGVAYLNHGSFGPPPRVVRQERRRWLDLVERDPMDFFMRRQEGELALVRQKLGQFLGTSADDLALVENATVAMNAVASSVKLQPGEEVLLNDHEYGAVKRIWQRACERSGAVLRVAQLPFPAESPEQVIDAIISEMNTKSRIVVFSQITSPTALVLPVQELTKAVHQRGALVCIDGPHAIAQVDLNLSALDCDYYTASLHKWLCAPFGSGFLYAHPRVQQQTEPAVLSWGRLLPETPGSWTDEFTWLGTRDPSSYLTVPTAIDFMQAAGLAAFRTHAHGLVKYGAEQVSARLGIPLPTEIDRWHGTMALAELPAGEAHPLREALWERYRIEIPVVAWGERRFVRLSAHLYTTPAEMDLLAQALGELLA